jgi:hypothetical protein
MKAALFCTIITALMLPTFLSGQSSRTDVRDPLVVVKGGYYGYIDHNGAFLIAPQFLWAGDFEDGLGTVYGCGRYLWIDASGQVLPVRPTASIRGAGWKQVGSRFAFVDGSGRLNTAVVFDETLPFSDGFAAVRVGNKWGFVDSNGQLVITPKYDSAYYFQQGVATAVLKDETLLIDKTGKVLARGFEQLSGIVAEGRVPASRDDKYGYLDLEGNVAIPLVYDGADTFSEGLAPVKKGNKWGYIDTKGSIVIPFVFDSAGVFGNGLAPVRVADESGFINSSGKFAFRLAFDSAPGFGSSGVSRFWTKDGSFGYVDTTGRVIWGPTREAPDHPPLLGWSEQGKVASCESLPSAMREAIAAFPKDQ